MVRPLGSEILVNDKTSFNQHNSVLVTSETGFVTGWVDVRSKVEFPNDEARLPVSDQIRGRQFTPLGQALAGSEVLSLRNEADPDHRIVALEGARLSNGDIALVWRSQFTDVIDEITRTFDPLLNPLEMDFVVQSSQLFRGDLDIAAGESGDYFIGSVNDGTAEIYNVVSAAARIDEDKPIREINALSLLQAPDGGINALYYGPAEEGDPPSVNLYKYNADASPIGEPYTLPLQLGNVTALESTRLTSGNYALVVTTSQGLSYAVIIDQTFDFVSLSVLPRVDEIEPLADGGFVVAWTGSDGSGSGIFTQTFSETAVATSAPMLVNSSVRNGQFDPDLLVLASGDIVVSWTDESRQGGDQTGSSIKARVFSLDGADRPLGTVESTAGNEVLNGTSAKDVFFFDTEQGTPLGEDVIRGFAPGDLIVTTSPILDANGDGRIKLNNSDRLILPSAEGSPDTDSTGTVAIFYESGGALSNLKFVDFQVHEFEIYYIYAAANDLIRDVHLTF